MAKTDGRDHVHSMSQASTFAVRCGRLAESPHFQRGVLAVILGNAILVGVETSGEVVAEYGHILARIHAIVLVLFVLELGIRIGARGRGWRDFFRSGWNVFDVVVVALSCVPAMGPWTTVARLARVLRVTRLLSSSPKLRLIVGTMVRSIPSLGHVGLLLGLVLYVYAVMGVHLFGAIDSVHWGTLQRALLTLFQILTLEGWVEIQRVSMAVNAWAWLYYSSFVLIAVFVVVNLFIAVVLSNLDDARRAEAAPEPTMADVLAELARIRALLHLQQAAPGAFSDGDDRRVEQTALSGDREVALTHRIGGADGHQVVALRDDVGDHRGGKHQAHTIGRKGLEQG
jgi:voltage-gated sodium channel